MLDSIIASSGQTSTGGAVFALLALGAIVFGLAWLRNKARRAAMKVVGLGVRKAAQAVSHRTGDEPTGSESSVVGD